MLNHSISNKMISLNSLVQLSGENNPAQVSRRRRTPSKYAESIRELTKMSAKNSRKDKNSQSNQDESPPINLTRSDKGNVLTCILPTRNKKLKLSIIIKKNPKPKVKKMVSVVSVEKEKEKQKDKERTKNVSLLDTLLQVVEQLKVDQQNKRDEPQQKPFESPCGQIEAIKKQNKSKKEKEEQEKYLRFYEKYRNLNEKFQLMQNQIVFI